jgi:nucleoid-associated protein YgaU
VKEKQRKHNLKVSAQEYIRFPIQTTKGTNVMGLFDKMFGRGASDAQQQPNAEKRFSELKIKYQSVLNAADQQHIQFHNLHVQDNKLFIKGTAPSEDAKNQFWNQIKLVNPNADDITADINVDSSRAIGAAAGGGSGKAGETYEVRSGDNLSKISKQFYGDPNEYMRIFYANRDQLRDPDKIQVGQKLIIPPDEK